VGDADRYDERRGSSASSSTLVPRPSVGESARRSWRPMVRSTDRQREVVQVTDV
jgi:hypothetical protein